MKLINFLKNIFKNELFRGSLTLLILITFGHFLNYLFHFIMARMLGPADYGILAVLISITYIFAAPSLSIQTVMSKQTIKLKTKKEYGKIKGLFKYLIKKLFLVSLAIFILFVLLSKFFLSDLLKIPLELLILTGTFLLLTFIYPIGTGILQGMKKFKAWGFNFILDCGLRLILGILLVFLGFRAYGAILATIIGLLVAFIFVFPFIKEITKIKSVKETINIFSKESLAVFLAMLFLVLMYSTDVILAKGFFSSEISGKYSALSLIGKIVFFVMMTIGGAMFPISSEKFINGNKNKSKKMIKFVWFVVISLCLIAITFFAIIPEFIINILTGSKYIDVSNLLVYIGMAFSFISFTYIFILYKISIDEFKAYHLFFLIIFFFTHMAFLFLFHETIKQFSILFAVSTFLIFIGSIIFIRKWEK